MTLQDSKEREAKIVDLLQSYKHQEIPTLLVELLTIRRERHRDKLEREEFAEVRGRAKECKDLLLLFS